MTENTSLSALSALLHAQIAQKGFITVADYMALCLGHPQFGYYMTHEPFGVAGDFTTAPEISQLFGESLAVWFMSQQQTEIITQLVEFGPGRGTLMADFWRGLSAMPVLRERLEIHLVEFSPRLRAVQEEKLSGLPVTWHTHFDTVPQRPSLLLANEFFDALPIEQAEFSNGHWRQRVIVARDTGFAFSTGAALQGIHVAQPTEGSIFEYAPLAVQMMDDFCYFLRKNGGALLAIDYGDTVPVNARIGETFQALHNHAPCSVFEHVGACDLTAHVAFDALCHVAVENGCAAHVTTQGQFLLDAGIRLRTEKLLAKATLEQARALKSGLHRLTDATEMGELFKVMVVTG